MCMHRGSSSFFAQRVQQQHMRLFSVELAEKLTSGRVSRLHIITFAQLDHRHNSLPQPQPQLPAWVHHSSLRARGHVDSCLSSTSEAAKSQKMRISTCGLLCGPQHGRAVQPHADGTSDSRVRDGKVFLRFCCRVEKATPVQLYHLSTTSNK